MLLCGQLLLRVAREAERNVLGACDRHRARAVRHRDGCTAEVAAVLLRLHVVLEEVVRRLGEVPEVRRLMLVAIGLIRSIAEVLRRVERFRQEHSETEARQERALRIALRVDLRADVSVGVDLKAAVEREERTAVDGGKAQAAGDDRHTVFHIAVARVDLRHRRVVARLLPLFTDKLVVVGRRAPDIPRHRARDDRLVALDHAPEYALGLREHIAEIRTADRDRAAVRRDRNRAGHKRLLGARRAGDDELVKAECMTLREEYAVVLLRAVAEQNGHVALGRDLAVQRDHATFVRGDRDVLDHAASHGVAVLLNLPRDHQEIVGIGKVAVIRQADLRCFRVEQLGAYRADDILILEQTGVRRAVGIHETVHAEVAVVRELAEIAAVAEDVAVVGRCAAVHGVVAPLPDEAADEAVVLHNLLLVLLRVSGAVAHRVDILALHERQRVLLVGEILVDPLRRGVHTAAHGERGEVVLTPARVIIRVFVMCQTGGIVRAHPCARLFKARTPAGLVAVRPHEHAGIVLVADHAALDAV